ncbi:hypothetical protein, partial [Actinomyces oricola]|uniref:hypothetical protein n=1 Tax=Actinomyces oricola TaxID=206043 RepID=UPI0019D41EBE
MVEKRLVLGGFGRFGAVEAGMCCGGGAGVSDFVATPDFVVTPGPVVTLGLVVAPGLVARSLRSLRSVKPWVLWRVFYLEPVVAGWGSSIVWLVLWLSAWSV